MSQTKSQKQTADLKDFAKLLKDNGFTVLVSATHPFKWLHFEKYGKFGTVQPDELTGLFNFSTDCKPNKECGTGFQTGAEVELNITHALNALNSPAWSSNYKRFYYEDVNDFINSTCNKWAEYYIL
jgi:hypothetical protein